MGYDRRYRDGNADDEEEFDVEEFLQQLERTQVKKKRPRRLNKKPHSNRRDISYTSEGE